MLAKPVICYDLNHISQVICGSHSYTGLTRVVYELAVALSDELSSSSLDFNFGVSQYPQFTTQLEDHFRQVGHETNFIKPGALGTLFYKIFVGLKLYPYEGQMLGKVTPKPYNGNRKIDLIHSPYASMNVDRNLNVIRVATVHDIIALTHPQYFTRRHQEQVRKNLCEVAASSQHFICDSTHTLEQFCEYFSMSDSVASVVPLAASKRIFYPERSRETIRLTREKYGIPEGRYLLALATMEPRKNLKGAINAFCNYLSQTREPDLYLVIAGKSGWLMQETMSELDGLTQVRDRVIFTGPVEEDDLSPLYSGADIFLYLSFHEGFGLPPLEAMQCGVPVLCSNTSSLPEVVADAGILVDPYSVDDICDGIRKLLESDQLGAQLIESGQRRAKEFAWSQTAQKVAGIYRELLPWSRQR